jgi:hypothetical protein
MNKAGFNPQARWDISPMPEENNSAQTNKITVLALFKNGKIYPRAFVLNKKEYKINAINYSWKERRGQEIINYFSVKCSPDLYQISFNNTTYGWQLDKIIE